MCGICGIVNISGERQPESVRLRVNAMLQALSHRGPDDVGLNASESAVLGATRLAIRGGDDGRQPMIDTVSGVVAVCNGEIDNHKELRLWLAERGRPVKQATDVAVIPGMYQELGEAFAEKLIGAFAIAVWDPRELRLTLVRDRAGERPLFFSQTTDNIVFATEIGSLVSECKLPVTFDNAALQRYLQFGLFAAPSSPFANIEKIPPGGMVQIDARGIRRSTYWRWKNVETPKQKPSLDAFDKIFRDAVRRQSDVDVDFGLFLSGGLDSSLISAVTRSLYPERPLKAYTLRFKVESFDEGNFAESVATSLKLESVPVWVQPEDLPKALSLLIKTGGEPLADPAWLPTALLARRAAEDVPVALVGEGADELFGGYPTYIGAGMAERFANLPAWVRVAVRRVVESLPVSDKKMTVSFLLKRFVQGAELGGMTRHELWMSNITPTILMRLGISPAASRADDVGSGLLLDRVQRWDLENFLAEGLLTKADRASMSSALELRAPFLDESVMAFAASLPAAGRVQNFSTKIFLKNYALRYLLKSIVHRRKRGLSVPIGRWLRGPLREWATAALGNKRLEQTGVRTPVALELLSEHCRHQADHARALWTLIVLSEWLNWVAEETACGGNL
ncbi:MAG TPA: asparagine synthase (glutamine-hydrolyzing) [Verrucomicrobiae bacterium]|jgi:asparagine synthase (glutamine-hydrolysing)|nr:asparagine synthase (glutamine-hydrolyzing) [Verrucomicrobiae bacterium]